MESLGVILPTKNSMKYLPDHLENLATWIDLAKEVVVVDSYSEDGSLDYIQKHLRHPNLRFVSHPPGLYASWNHGIRQLSAEYCYISTIGDALSRHGAEYLVSTAASLQCDVLVSRPEFVEESGLPCSGPRWPMDDVIDFLAPECPLQLPSAMAVATVLARNDSALTGSCASALFRTAVLQQFPFPLNAGTAGDRVWGLQNAGRLKFAVTPQRVTTFRIHPSTASAQELCESKEGFQFSEAATQMLDAWIAECSGSHSEEVIADMRRLLEASCAYETYRMRHNLRRRSRWPWCLSPAGWKTRSLRNQTKRQVFELKEKIFHRCSLRSVISGQPVLKEVQLSGREI